MAKNKSPKRGRPPKDLAGDVQARILDAAQQLFLEKGFRSASIDDISELAPASKPTIYAHFPGKEALFVAVVARTINGLTDFEGFTPAGRTIQEKLTNLGVEIVEQIRRGHVGPHARDDRRGAAISRVEPKCSRRGARPRGWGSFAALERGNAEGRALTKRTFQRKAERCDRADVHGSHSASDAHEISDG